MTSLLNPYLGFDGNAREAMTFYQSVFGGQLDVNTHGDFGNPDPSLKDKIMHAQLETDAGYTLMGADMMPGRTAPSGDAFSVSLSGDDAALRDYFAKLGEGGTVTLKLEKQVWGAEFGQVTDTFGVSWMVNVTPST